MRLFTALLAALLAAACTTISADDNPFGRNYVNNAASTVTVKSPAADPHIFRGSSREEDDSRLLADGYQLIGTSAFEAGDVAPEKALEQARNVHADVVMVYSELAGRKIAPAGQSPAEPATAGSERKGHALGSYGRLIPIEENFYRYSATFWIKLAP